MSESKKKLAEGEVMEEPKPEAQSEGDAFLKDVSAGFKDELNHDSDAVKSYLSNMFGGMVDKQEPEPMAEGGVPGVTFMENLPQKQVEKVVHLDNPPTPEPALPADPDREKLNAIYNAMGMGKYAMGGMVPQPPTGPTLNTPSPQDPNFWDQVKNALAKVGSPITQTVGGAMNKTADIAGAVTPAIEAIAPQAVSGVNKLTGLDLPIPPAPPPAPQGAPAELAAPMPPIPPSTVPSVSPVSPQTPKMASASSGQDINNLFNQDTSTLTEGVEATDRQAVVDANREGQTGMGSIIAQALAGFGDAVSAKGGRHQNALKDVFNMQKQQRDEALANFDKGRQARLEKLDLQTKMGNNAIQQLAAQDAYGVDESLNKQLGAPPGTKHKDLPLFMQMASAKAAQAEKDGDLYMRAHKQAADEVESAVKNAGMFNVKPSPEQIKAQGAKLADKYFNRAKGNILFSPSDGQNPVWIPAKNIEAAKKMDPQGQIIP